MNFELSHMFNRRRRPVDSSSFTHISRMIFVFMCMKFQSTTGHREIYGNKKNVKLYSWSLDMIWSSFFIFLTYFLFSHFIQNKQATNTAFEQKFEKFSDVMIIGLNFTWYDNKLFFNSTTPTDWPNEIWQVHTFCGLQIFQIFQVVHDSISSIHTINLIQVLWNSIKLQCKTLSLRHLRVWSSYTCSKFQNNPNSSGQ